MPKTPVTGKTCILTLPTMASVLPGVHTNSMTAPRPVLSFLAIETTVEWIGRKIHTNMLETAGMVLREPLAALGFLLHIMYFL